MSWIVHETMDMHLEAGHSPVRKPSLTDMRCTFYMSATVDRRRDVAL